MYIKSDQKCRESQLSLVWLKRRPIETALENIDPCKCDQWHGCVQGKVNNLNGYRTCQRGMVASCIGGGDKPKRRAGNCYVTEEHVITRGKNITFEENVQHINSP